MVYTWKDALEDIGVSLNGKIKESGLKIDENIKLINNKGVDISKFGAVPNNETFDNRDIIMNCIKYAVSNNINAVFIPPQTYYVSAKKPIYIPSNFMLYGIKGASEIKVIKSTYTISTLDDYNNKAKNSIIAVGDPNSETVGNANVEFSNISIDSLIINGNVESKISIFDNVTDYFNAGYNVYAGWCRNLNISNCTIKNSFCTGIMLDRNYQSSVVNCDIYKNGLFGIPTGSRNGISMTGKKDITKQATFISGCFIHDNGDIGLQFAFTPVTIVNNHIYNNATFGIEGDTSYNLQTNGEYGDCVINSNYVYNNGKKGITIGNVNSQKIVVNGNIVKKHICGGIEVSQYSNADAIVSNNIVYSVDNTSLNEANTIAIYVKASNSSIINNIIDGTCNINGIIQVDGNTTQILNNNIINSFGTYAFNVRATNIMIKNNNIESLSKVASDNNIGRIINIYGSAPKNIAIENNFINGGYREFFRLKDLPTGSIATLRIIGNTITNCTQGEYSNLISADVVNNIAIDYLIIKDNYYTKDDLTLKLYKFIFTPANVTISNYFNGGNYFNSTLSNETTKIVFTTVPTNIKNGDNIW